ncbi:DUF3426 domain-containing protein, partial [Thiohalobacter sp.]|uniref:DUF3426 domain-containing protein n=1 Tax=Thiohalobacter sp. TaxID=2025948 RepID=UPI00260B5C39
EPEAAEPEAAEPEAAEPEAAEPEAAEPEAAEPEAAEPELPPPEPPRLDALARAQAVAALEATELPMRRRSASPGEWLLAGVLLLALLLQAAYAFRVPLARDAGLGPWVVALCERLGCSLPPRRLPAAIEVLEREVRSHPQMPGALLVSATFANGADFVQPYPLVGLVMSDVSGAPVAARWFTPDEYLPPGVDARAGFAPGARLHLVLELEDPGPRVVSYQFEFL